MCAILAQVHSKKKFSVEDFLPPPPEADTRKNAIMNPEQSPEQMLAICQLLFGDTNK